MSVNPVPDESARIKEVLREHPLGLSIKEIAAVVAMSWNSVAKYLDVLAASGHCEVRHVGNAKLYTLSHRVPVDSIISLSREMIVVLDRDLRIVQAGSAFLDFVGMSAEAVTGMRLSSLPVFLLSEKEEGELSALVAGGPPWKKEIRVVRHGDEHFFSGRFFPTVLENGGPVITMMLDDITERRQAGRAGMERDRHPVHNLPDFNGPHVLP